MTWQTDERKAFEEGFRRATFLFRQLLLIRRVMKKKHRKEIVDVEKIVLNSYGFKKDK